MEAAQGVVAPIHAGGDNPKGHDVIQVVHLDAPALALELLVDAPQVLGPPGDLGLHVPCLHLLLHQLYGILDEPLAVLLQLGHLLRDGREVLWVQVAKAEVLQLGLHPLDPEPAGDGSVDLSRLPGDALLLLLWHVAQGPHVVEPIRQLDEDDPDVPRHGQDHLAEVLGLSLLPRGEAQGVQLGHPLHEEEDVLAKPLPDLIRADVGVLDAVVEQRCTDGRHVQPELRQVPRNTEGVYYVWLTGLALLPLVGCRGKLGGPLDGLNVRIGEIAADSLGYIFQHRNLPFVLST